MVLIDAIVLKVREGSVANRPVYVAMGVNIEGERDVLGMWTGPSGGEGAKQWMNMPDANCAIEACWTHASCAATG
ncbi:MAG TPA: transposase [Candidatus Luteococcus avicola]|nr:transposase [Candidatus Luteococcus avicola]